jgi:hypothetical protein
LLASFTEGIKAVGTPSSAPMPSEDGQKAGVTMKGAIGRSAPTASSPYSGARRRDDDGVHAPARLDVKTQTLRLSRSRDEDLDKMQ